MPSEYSEFGRKIKEIEREEFPSFYGGAMDLRIMQAFWRIAQTKRLIDVCDVFKLPTARKKRVAYEQRLARLERGLASCEKLKVTSRDWLKPRGAGSSVWRAQA